MSNNDFDYSSKTELTSLHLGSRQVLYIGEIFTGKNNSFNTRSIVLFSWLKLTTATSQIKYVNIFLPTFSYRHGVFHITLFLVGR